eukprot:894415-Rhodomonas_salina.1
MRKLAISVQHHAGRGPRAWGLESRGLGLGLSSLPSSLPFPLSFSLPLSPPPPSLSLSRSLARSLALCIGWVDGGRGEKEADEDAVCALQNHGQTPVFEAAMRGHAEVVERLIEAKCDVDKAEVSKAKGVYDGEEERE